MNRLTALTIGVAAGSVLTLTGPALADQGVGHAISTTRYSPIITWISNHPCKEEDSVNCSWNAQEKGNRHGHSFIVRRFPGKNHLVCVMYERKRYALKHDHCTPNGGFSH